MCVCGGGGGGGGAGGYSVVPKVFSSFKIEFNCYDILPWKSKIINVITTKQSHSAY